MTKKTEMIFLNILQDLSLTDKDLEQMQEIINEIEKKSENFKKKIKMKTAR